MYPNTDIDINLIDILFHEFERLVELSVSHLKREYQSERVQTYRKPLFWILAHLGRQLIKVGIFICFVNQLKHV